MALLDAKIAEAEAAMAKAETTAEKRKAKERKEDLMRLKRVEVIYVSSERVTLFNFTLNRILRVLCFLCYLAGFLFFSSCCWPL